MRATDVLVEEHRIIEGVLNTLELGSNAWKQGTCAAGFFLSAVEFIRGSLTAATTRKKKVSCSITCRSREYPIKLPLGVMLAEHEAGRQYRSQCVRLPRRFRLEIKKPSAGSLSTRSYVGLAAPAYIQRRSYPLPVG